MLESSVSVYSLENELCTFAINLDCYLYNSINSNLSYSTLTSLTERG